MRLRRGEVYLAFLPEEENSSIQSGLRPIVILSNDLNNIHSSNVQYVPLTSQLKRLDLPTHVTLSTNFLEDPSMALCEQMQMKSIKSVENYINKAQEETQMNSVYLGKLPYSDMCRISYGVATQLGFVFMLSPMAYA